MIVLVSWVMRNTKDGLKRKAQCFWKRHPSPPPDHQAARRPRSQIPWPNCTSIYFSSSVTVQPESAKATVPCQIHHSCQNLPVLESLSNQNQLKPQHLATYITLVKILPVLESLSNQNRLKPQHLARYITLVKLLPVLESLSNQNRLKPQYLARYITLIKILPVLGPSNQNRQGLCDNTLKFAVLESLSNQNRLKPQHLARYITLVKILPVLESKSNQNRLKPQHLATYITLVKILPVLESLPPRIGWSCLICHHET
ncbi:hypothetical protein J6590_061105 [Homalodisca vitripennis]|nr:hypothetical protein J6590_061105 [Homalodisca vitripennis]